MSYICKIANYEELIEKCDYEINRHPGNAVWTHSKQIAIDGFNNQSKIMYIGKLDDEIICEATAIIKEIGFKDDIKNTENLLSNDRVYLSAFRTNKEYEGKGYFKQLFNYMINDLKNKGYKEACLGVEPSEVRNLQIYFHVGFTNYIKTTIETMPAPNPSLPPIEEIVSFYYKKI